jgi:hypothetical protein
MSTPRAAGPPAPSEPTAVTVAPVDHNRCFDPALHDGVATLAPLPIAWAARERGTREHSLTRITLHCEEGAHQSRNVHEQAGVQFGSTALTCGEPPSHTRTQGLESPVHEDGHRRPKRPAVRKNHSRETADPDQRGSAPHTSASVVATASRMSARDKNSGCWLSFICNGASLGTPPELDVHQPSSRPSPSVRALALICQRSL